MTLEQKKDECLALLRSTNRPNIELLIDHITKMGYFVAPGSMKHHRFEGGLLSHSLETYRKAIVLRKQKIKKGFSPDSMPVNSVIIAALMHDLCKADELRYNHDEHRVCSVKKSYEHSKRSVSQVGDSGFVLTQDEKDAILWHMGGKRRCRDEKKRKEFFQSHPLSDIIFKADKLSISEAKRRHHRRR